MSKLPTRSPSHSVAAGMVRYETDLDCRTWLRAHGYRSIAQRIDKIEAEWKAAGKKTRRDWWLFIAGTPSGQPKTVAGYTFPMLAAARRRQGYPLHADAIEKGPHELAPPIRAQAALHGEKFKRSS